MITCSLQHGLLHGSGNHGLLTQECMRPADDVEGDKLELHASAASSTPPAQLLLLILLLQQLLLLLLAINILPASHTVVYLLHVPQSRICLWGQP
jgi:hypothetical protein